MSFDNEEDLLYAQKQALPISTESGDPISEYLLAVRKESLAGPPVTFITNRPTSSIVPTPKSLPEIDRTQISEHWSSELMIQFLILKEELLKIQHSSPTANPYVPETTANWRKFFLESPPEISYFFIVIDRQTVFRLLVYITRWLSITSRPTLSQWIWKLFLRIDNVLDANECSVIRDLGKKARIIKSKQLKDENKSTVDSISKYTTDMILILVGNYYGQWDLLQG